MTPDIALLLAILVIAVTLFVTEKLRVDVVAMMVLVTLALTGLITPEEAVSSFRNPAVITVGAVFVLSAGLSRTGVAGILGRHVLRLAGGSELLLVVLIMTTSAFLSAFMNNVGVAALLLPVIMDIARRTNRPPSKLLIPLAYSSLLGGLTTLIGTPPNILVSAGLEQHPERPGGVGLCRDVESSQPGVVPRVDRRAVGQQQLDHRGVVADGCAHQRREAVDRRAFRVGASLQQRARGRDVS